MDAPVGITIGDPAGIGPEVVGAALGAGSGSGSGSGSILGGRFRLYGPGPMVRALAAAVPGCDAVATTPTLDGVEIGRYTPASGAASVAALLAAARDLAGGRIAALVTGPISKAALAEAGLPHPGQTELVAEACGVGRFAMMLAGPRLRVVLATTHMALRDVPAALTRERVFDASDLVAAFLRDRLRIEAPRLAVLGLNPHASDGGRFGDEEERVIAPAIARLRAAGIDAAGPLPADTAFHRAAAGAFDAVVAMYHDQGLGPLKLLHFPDAINVTLGLPRPRCSPDHGPAFDLAGTGRADPSSTRAAVAFAVTGSSPVPA
ncbi:MAG: 4-hydroxythreonine-4-phosphate dehydrogenase PdxA [Deltaproteobacteria bacterium]|nr:4-hydroxythreonine-4-phosphate dehydrogenase PdxA [Deltaproteobacteria bacterium]